MAKIDTITKNRAIQLPITPQFQQRPSSQWQIMHQGKNYVVLPADEYQTQRSNQMGWLMMAACGGATAATVALIFFAPSLAAPQAAVEPVVIEKPVLIDRNCIAWCSK
ncbi:hypothetical protein IQ268_30585 [Oculatella sp. LEGE 06141]|uniref:hypothetical protein n=1 Tax=Oculatella sp. LEGE 06141 TaxID=1828648 RepID=UPI00187E223C|nr:hypothetical protein [Oculatella sp. LEGE 06141]MBE9182886.1 hypothetical protein [Oculatella sp. LEGE 06141]